MSNLMDLILTMNVTLVPAATSATGLGDLVLVVPQGVTAGGNKFTVVKAADVAALLAATNITQPGADAINLALSQNPHPPLIRVLTYVTTGIPAAMAIMKAELSWSPGVLVFVGLNDVAEDITELSTFITANRWKYLNMVESPSADLLTSGKPAALEDLEGVEETYVVKVISALSDDSYGSAFGALAASKQMVGINGGPVASRVRVTGVDVASLTSTQLSFLEANGAGTIIQLDEGNSALERVMFGLKTYGDVGLTPVASMLFAVKQVRGGIRDLILNQAILQAPILATPEGEALVEAAVTARLDPMMSAGQPHFVKSKQYPRGFLATAEVIGDEIFTTVNLQLAQEVRRFTFNMIGEIV